MTIHQYKYKIQKQISKNQNVNLDLKKLSRVKRISKKMNGSLTKLSTSFRDAIGDHESNIGEYANFNVLTNILLGEGEG